MNVSAKQYWSKTFTFICFFPQIVLIALYIMQGYWMMFAFQALMLMFCCFNNYLLCENNNIKQELFMELHVNLALIEYIKEKILKGEK